MNTRLQNMVAQLAASGATQADPVIVHLSTSDLEGAVADQLREFSDHDLYDGLTPLERTVLTQRNAQNHRFLEWLEAQPGHTVAVAIYPVPDLSQ